MADVPAVDARRLFAVHAAPTGSVVALQGLSLRVEPGEVLALLGPSGAGKSTLMRCLGALHRPLAGELHAFGVRLHDASPRALAAWRAATVGSIGQHYARSLSPDLRVLELVLLRAALRGEADSDTRRRAAELLERAGLRGRERARRRELSGGEQQRVALCAALLAQPRLLLADEVTGELDDATGTQVLALLRELAAEQGVTVILATHDPKGAAAADRCVTIRDGRITAELSSAGERRAMIDESGLIRIEPDDLEAAGLTGAVQLEITSGAITVRGQVLRSRTPRAPDVAVQEQTPSVNAVRLRGVGRVFGGHEVVRARDMLLDRPGLHALVGPSGSGKTTLLHLIAGLDRPTSGEIDVAGERVDGLDRTALAAFRRRHLAIVPQATGLAGHLTAREHVELALQIRGLRDSAAAEAALEAVGLRELARRRAEQLSGGERQRVAIARAIVVRPSVLLADEPTANLDQRNSIAIARLLRELARRDGTVVLCATHDPSVIEQADAVLAASL